MLSYKSKSTRKCKNSVEKKNIFGNSTNKFTFPLSLLTPNNNDMLSFFIFVFIISWSSIAYNQIKTNFYLMQLYQTKHMQGLKTWMIVIPISQLYVYFYV